MPAFVRSLCLSFACLGMSACAPLLSLVGTNQTLVQVVAQGERVKVAGDGASFVTSKKTLTDHAISMVTGEDCKLFNLIDKQPVCADKPAAIAVQAKQKDDLGQTAPAATFQTNDEAIGAMPDAIAQQPRAPALDLSRGDGASGD